MTALHRKLLRDLLHMRGQLLAVTLVLACGVATYVTMRSAFRSLELAQADYYSSFRFADIFVHLRRAPVSLGAALADISGVTSVQTRIVMDVSLDIPGLPEPATGRLISIPERRSPMLNDLFLREGRYLEPGGHGEVLISEAFALANRLTVGASLDAVLNGKWERLTIVGIALSPEYIYEIRPSEVFPDNRRFGVLWMSGDVLESSFNMKEAFNDVSLSLSRGADEREVISRVDRVLSRYGSLGAFSRTDQISYRFLTDELGELRAYGFVLPLLFLGVVSFLLNVLLSRLVSTQRAQIAVLKAFGYTRYEIGLHYLELALVAVSAGAVLGVAAGLWLSVGLMNLYTRYFHFPALRLQSAPDILIVAVAIAAGAACLGAVAAVRRAVALAPAEAMRPEPPATFRPGLLERLGLRTFLSPASRMVVRNLDRRRWRATFSVLAVSLSIAIIVAGSYAIDAVELLVRIQFQSVQREDVTLVFQELQSSRARYELARLPGVLRVEAFREIPARLRFGHRKRRVGILGLPVDAELRRPVDSHLRPVVLPPTGLVLNKALAELLVARPGDTITVEVLEGARPVREVTIMALADEPVGLGVYMDLSALHRLMREGETLSGAWLRVDARAAPGLYASLKRTPSISGVAVRQVMLASFWKSFGESIQVSTAFLVGFAVTIAFGVVYNGARVALSERGHELASLRVLGYTRGEITRILLGEQAALLLAAIPLGVVLGYLLSILLSHFFARELFRLPLVANPATYAFAILVVVIATLVSGLIVARRLWHMDLTEVLKARE